MKMISALCLALGTFGATVTSVSAQIIPGGYFRLTTMIRESNKKCLEGNRVNGSMGGAIFMNSCQNVTGQMWRAVPIN